MGHNLTVSQRDKVTGETLWTVALTVIKSGLSYAVPLIILWGWNNNILGQFVYLESILLTTLPFASLGMNVGLTKFLASHSTASAHRDKDNTPYLSFSIGAVSFACAVGILINITLIKYRVYNIPASQDSLAIIFVFSLLPLALLRVLSGTYTGLRRPAEGIFRTDILFRIPFVILLIGLSILGTSPDYIYLGYIALAGIVLLCAVLPLLSEVIASLWIATDNSLRDLTHSNFAKYSVTIVGLTGIGVISSRLDKVIVGSVMNSDILGRYFMVALIPGSFTILQRGFNATLAPFIAAAFKAGDDLQIESMYRVAVKLSVFGVFPLALIGILQYGYITELTGLVEYRPLWPVFGILAAMKCIEVTLGPVNNLCRMIGLEMQLLKYNILMIPISTLVLYFGAEFGGVVGVAMATVVAILLQQGGAVMIARSRQKLQVLDKDFLYLPVVLAPAAMSTVGNGDWGLWWILVWMGAALAASYLIAGIVSWRSSDTMLRYAVQEGTRRIRTALRNSP